MAPSTPLPDQLHAIMSKSRKKLVMAYVRSSALTAWLFASGRVEMEDGGRDITNPLAVGRNPNVTSYEYYGELPVAATQDLETVSFGFSRIAGTVIISDQEQDENKGESAIVKLLKTKMELLEESINEYFAACSYGSGAGLDPYGLQAAVADNPTAGSFGGIQRTNFYWRSSSYNMNGGLTAANIEEVFDDILLDLTVRKERPDIIIVGRNIWRMYRQAVRDKLVINLSDIKKDVTDLGFKGLAHDSVPIVYDEECPPNKAYFLNSKYLRMHILKGVNMKTKNLSSPWNIDAIGKRTVWQGQLCNWRMYRTHGVLIN